MGPKGQRVWDDVRGLLQTVGLCATLSWSGAAMAQPEAPAEPPPEPPPVAETGAAGEPGAPEATDAPEAPAADSAQTVTVSQFRLRQAAADGTLRPLSGEPDMPPVVVRLAREGDVFTSASADGAAVEVRLDQVSSPMTLDRRGLLAVANAVSSHLKGAAGETRYIGFGLGFKDVVLTPEGIEDGRAGDSVLTIIAQSAGVSQVRSLSFGDRFREGDRKNRPEHERIRAGSPLQPGVTDGSLLRRDLLDEYVFRLNRHPGRRVDAALAPDVVEEGAEAAQPTGLVTVDYLVSENKPWTLYVQGSNTGTEDTDEWRQRIGFTHNQLTGNDDILSLDFITALFDETNAFIGTYDAPIGKSDTWRWKVFGTWNEFTASDLGQNTDFTGDGWSAGGEVSYNLVQDGPWFVDAFAGARWQHVFIDDKNSTTGEDDFFLPIVGLRAERTTDRATTNAMFAVEWNMKGIAGTSEEEVNKLGRENVDAEWYTLQWDVSHAVYLEPLLFGERFENSSHPNPINTLAHEFVFGFRGQHAPNARLAPSFQQVVGGLYTVRGYEESVAAGDSVYVGTLEYRFHFPNSRSPREPGTLFGEQFLWAPQQPYGRADWDLIFRAFYDVGLADINDRDDLFESDDLIMGAGVGLEFVFKRNLSVRLDYGIALKDLFDKNANEYEAEVGDDRLYFVGTLLF